MKLYKVKDISRLTSTSVRTLQYYDDINLLKPHHRNEAGHRFYTDESIFLLQQITTLKYMGLSLDEIKQTISQLSFDILSSLKFQADILEKRAQQIKDASNLLKYITAQLEAGQPINWTSTFEIIKILECKMTKDSIKDQYKLTPEGSELGDNSSYDSSYNPQRLYPIPRKAKRDEIGVKSDNLPFYGYDCWNHYEVSWLNGKGKPMVAIAEIQYDCHTPFIVESKSLKLYFNSLNNTCFDSVEKVTEVVKKDLEKILEGEVKLHIQLLHQLPKSFQLNSSFAGICLDVLDVNCNEYLINTGYLSTISESQVTESLFSDCLKSNCLVTNQPDWGSVQIQYTGKKINHEGLLKYIVSFRNHNEFHEQCIERIFVDIMEHCKPEKLTVYGRYTRRGGIDINAYRSTEATLPERQGDRLIRQ